MRLSARLAGPRPLPLVFVYFVGTLVLSAYHEEQENMDERYKYALQTVDRCVAAGLSDIEHRTPHEMGGPK